MLQTYEKNKIQSNEKQKVVQTEQQQQQHLTEKNFKVATK